ncbi:MAG TPA: FG-GAP-like repeat-containing protein [Methylomirabilota bacterium]|nr:FG-GAP-like repeat-containing protein [Methylomirabilota bacterium]
MAFLLTLLSGCDGCRRSTGPGADPVKTSEAGSRYIEAMQTGKNYYDKGDFTRALPLFQEALKLEPTSIDAHLNVANASLAVGQVEAAIRHAQEVVALDVNNAAGHYIIGIAQLRQGQAQEAVKSLQTSSALDLGVAAPLYQLGLAHMQLRQWEDAITQFETVISIETNHPAAHYNLSQAYIRANRADEAQAALENHQAIIRELKGPPPTSEVLERSVHTLARAPFVLEQPAEQGIPVAFTNATTQVFGALATNLVGPPAVIDVNHRGANDIFIQLRGQGFQLLWNSNGVFNPHGEPAPAQEGATFHKLLVGDLQNDRNEDVVALSAQGLQVFRFATNVFVTEATPFTRLQGLATTDGALLDLDFTGKLDLLAVTAQTNEVRVFRNLAQMMYRETTATSGIPAIRTATHIVLDDWNNDDMADLFIVQKDAPPLSFAKVRGGGFVSTNYSALWPTATALAIGDLNNDFRLDAILLTPAGLRIHYTGIDKVETLTAATGGKHIELLDYDNDGWLDIFLAGAQVQAWRNRGAKGFEETTSALKLTELRNYDGIAKADFDGDCDTDLVLWSAQGAPQFLRNEGGSANQQLKLWLWGNRSNASGLGIRIEAVAGSWRAIRTVHELPVEIGIGRRSKLDSLTLRWFDLSQPIVDVQVSCTNLMVAEQVLPTGSCPYVYVWDGEKYRFVSDILGSAPLGLPIAEGVYIDADTDEYVWIGNESNVKPRDGDYVIQITEELREVLYLDEAKLVVVDHLPGTDVYPTDKLLPRKPYPPGTIVTVTNEQAVRKALTLEGADVTEALRHVDQTMVSPARLLLPQYRGWAERHGVILDFGEINTNRPIALAMTGWLRFGGGMANMSSSRDASLPFPFPTLEAEVPGGVWTPVDVVVGAPSGKTKRVFVDLAGKLPPQTQRLRLTASFEIHWDKIALVEKVAAATTVITHLTPKTTHLHWRGYSVFADLPWSQPLTPIYDQVVQQPPWRITPSGWCTRYGPVDELVAKTDDALVLLNGGDELTLTFPASSLPPKPPGHVRDFFLFTDGWDKDADFHVAQGFRVEPMPFHGINDQQYGSSEYPAHLSREWMERYNTRWVPPLTLRRAAPQPRSN